MHQRGLAAQTRKRKGTRAAYKFEKRIETAAIGCGTSVDRVFQLGHIDHTEVDIELSTTTGTLNLGRPWLTVLVDQYSRRTLAYSLIFDPPSYRSCLLVLRACVFRHRRLPQMILGDGGPEFDSVYYESVLARYQCTKKTRPPSSPRFGSILERLFGTANTQLFNILKGNTQLMKEPRQATKSVNPKCNAIWTLPLLHERIGEYLFEVYDDAPHSLLHRSPRDLYNESLSVSGHRNHVVIPYDSAFIMATLPPTRKGTAKVQPGKGVKVNHLRYWASEMDDSTLAASHVPIRYDPFDAGHVYAFIGSRWIECISEHHDFFSGRSEKELALSTTEFYRRQRETTKVNCSASRLRMFYESLEWQELLMQQARDLEVRIILNQAPDPRVPAADGTTNNGDPFEDDAMENVYCDLR